MDLRTAFPSQEELRNILVPVLAESRISMDRFVNIEAAWRLG